MIAPTRRSLIGGAIATAATPALAQARTRRRFRVVPAKAKIVRRGRAIAVAPRSGRLVVAHDRLRTIAIAGDGQKRLVDVGGQPLEVAASPDGRLGAVTTASWDEPGLVIVDLRRAKIVKRLVVGPAPFGVAFSADGKRIVVAGGDAEGEVRVVDLDRLRVGRSRSVGDSPRAVAPVPRSDAVWVALNGPDRVVLVNSRSGQVGRSLATPPLPDRIAVSADGKGLLVSHAEPGSKKVSEIVIRSGELRRHTAGRQPSGVAWTRGGRRVVALGGAGQILVIGPGGRRSRHEVGGSPRGLAVDGGRVWTVDALTGKIARVRA